MKNTIIFLMILSFVVVGTTGCQSFQEQYKPIYQVKPQIKKLEN